MNFLNFIVIGFVLAMAYYWYTQGLFSSLLHLVVVVVAGTLAFAFWEPASHWMLETTGVSVSWGVSLLGIFLVLLFGLRLLVDHFVAGNLPCPNLVNVLGGGLCGAASAMLTAGIVIIGIGYTPMPVALMGYQPYGIAPAGGVEETGDRLWLPADNMAGGFFTRLSGGAFAPMGDDVSLATHRPELAANAAIIRLRNDENASIIAQPSAVSLEGVHVHGLPSEDLPGSVVTALGSRAEQSSRQLVVAATRFELKPGTYDLDSTVRIAPSQVRLVTFERVAGRREVRLHEPVAYSKRYRPIDGRRLNTFGTNRAVAYSGEPNETFGWVFMPPAGEEPAFLMVRQLRMTIDTVSNEPEALVELVGTYIAPEDEPDADDGDDERSTISGRRGPVAGQVARDIKQTSDLPRPVSKNFARGLDFHGSTIVSGRSTVTQAPGGLSQSTRVESINHPEHMRMVQLRVDMERARSLLGGARVAGATVDGVSLEDSDGERILPVAYVLERRSGGQEIHVDLTNPMRSARQLPGDVDDDDNLYLYFLVSPHVTLERYWIGSQTSQTIDPPFRVE